MHALKTASLAGALLASAALSTSALAEVSANVGATSNYVWRGVTQTDDRAAVSGGLDFEHASGFYAGTWLSNVDFPGAGDTGTEVDLYAGYAGEVGALGYDLGLIRYGYPQHDDLDWVEAYVGLSYGRFSAKYSFSNDVFGTDTDGAYLEAAVDFELGREVGLVLHAGRYSFDDPAAAGLDDYTDYSVSLTKDEFALTVSDTDIDGDDYRVFVTWSRSFDL